MAIRYRTFISDINGKSYLIGLYDKSYEGSILGDFDVNEKGFEIKYDGGDKNYSPIIGSELTITIILQKNAQRDDTNLFTFLKQIVNQNTQLYYIVIREQVAGEYVDFWTGNIVQNQSQWANAALESGLEFQLIANDFAFLNNKIFVPSTPITNNYTLTELLYLALKYMNCWDLKLGDGLFLSHNINWFENRITGKPNVNVLDLISSIGSNFFELNEETEENAIYFIDVLKTIVTIFGCRIIQSQGRFWLVQLQNNTASTVTYRHKSFNNLNASSSSISVRQSVNNSDSNALKILAGAIYTTERPAKAVKLNKPRGTNIVQTQTRSVSSRLEIISNIQNVGLFAGGGNNRIGISINLVNELIFGALRADAFFISSGGFSGSTQLTNLGYRRSIPISIGVYSPGGVWRYVQKVGNNLVWTISATPIYISILMPQTGSVTNVLRFFKNDFITPPLPNGLYSEILVKASITYDEPTWITSPIFFYKGYFTGEMTVRYLENGTSQDEDTTYIASIDPVPFDAIEQTLDEVLLYENGLPSPKGNMVLDPFGFTQTWVVGSGTTQYSILELVVLNAMGMNGLTKEVIQATIMGNYYPHLLLRYDNKNWHLKQATFCATDNTWNGEWYELLYSNVDLLYRLRTNTGTGGAAT